MTTIFGYPVKLILDYHGEEVDVTAAVKHRQEHPLITIDENVVLDLVVDHSGVER